MIDTAVGGKWELNVGCIDWSPSLCGPMIKWLAHLEFELTQLSDPGSSLGSCHWVATLGKLFTHTASPVSQLQETGVQKGVFVA